MQAKNFQPGKKSSPKVAGGGLKKPTYHGGPQERSSSKASQSSQAAPYRQGMSHARGSSGGGGAKDSSHGYGPNNGQMPSGSARGHESYPTRASGVTHRGGHKHTTANSYMRSSRRGA